MPKIRFVTGKGGVGKSMYSLSLAMSSAKKGKKTLLVELGDQSFFRWVLPKVPDFKPAELSKNLFVARWDGASCLREYGIHLIKSERLVTLFMENKVSRSLIRAAPGLLELALLGKATSGPPRNIGPKFDFDSVVIDCFSTGHFMALMKAPPGFARAFGIGPMGEQSRDITNCLKDPELCDFHFVSLAENMSVIELKELMAEFAKLNYGKPILILNKNFEKLPAIGLAEQQYLTRKIEQSDLFAKQLEGLGKLIKIPFYFENQFFKVAELAGERLHDLA